MTAGTRDRSSTPARGRAAAPTSPRAAAEPVPRARLARRPDDQLPPGARRRRPAAGHRPGHGLLRLLDRGGAGRRAGLGARRPAGDLGGPRPRRDAGRAAAAGRAPAALVADRADRGRRPAAAGARSRDRAEAQRRPAVVRPRVRLPPAVRGGQAGLRAVGRARARAARALPDDDVAAGAGAAGLRRALAAAHRRAGLRRRWSPSGWCSSGCSGPAGCRCAGSAWSLAGGAALLVAAGHASRPTGWPGSPSFLDPFSDPTDGGFQAIRGMYALATGGLWGVGLGQQRDEVEPAAARRVRLHLRDHRRGARLPRLPGRRHPVRRARLRRLPDRPPLRRPVRPAGQRGDHRLADRPGRDEHGLRGRAAAGHRRPAAADLRGRHLAGADPVHRRAARPLRPLRARGDRGAARPDARPAGPAPPAGPGCRGRPGPPAPPSGGAAPARPVVSGGRTVVRARPGAPRPRRAAGRRAPRRPPRSAAGRAPRSAAPAAGPPPPGRGRPCARRRPPVAAAAAARPPARRPR